jgi:hypothetical protein
MNLINLTRFDIFKNQRILNEDLLLFERMEYLYKRVLLYGFALYFTMIERRVEF